MCGATSTIERTLIMKLICTLGQFNSFSTLTVCRYTYLILKLQGLGFIWGLFHSKSTCPFNYISPTTNSLMYGDSENQKNIKNDCKWLLLIKYTQNITACVSVCICIYSLIRFINNSTASHISLKRTRINYDSIMTSVGPRLFNFLTSFLTSFLH